MKRELGCGAQDVGAGPDHGGGSEPPNFRSQIADCRLQARRAATGCCALPPGRAGRKKEQCRMQNEAAVGVIAGVRRGQATESTETTEGRGRRGSLGEASVRFPGSRMGKYSLMFAYVRLCSLMFAFLGKKCCGHSAEANPSKSDQIKPNPTKNRH